MMDWVASALTFFGTIILVKWKPWWVFAMFAVGNSIWVYHWWLAEEWSAMILVSFFLLQNIWGLIEWRGEQRSMEKTAING